MVRINFIKKLVPIEYDYVDISLESKPWIEHRSGKLVDVVALALPQGIDCQLHVLDLSLSETDILVYPAQPISIIGFPLGLQAMRFPIWLTGFIASEPYIDAEGKPLFYANVSGREGLSGAPVVARVSGAYQDSKGDLFLNGSQRTKFLGVYSGRAYDKTEVCRVWKSNALQELDLE